MANDEIFYEGGIDLNSNMTFEDGDIVLVEYADNLCQAVTNRLNTSLNELDLFYEDYGSILTGFFGSKGNNTTIGFIKTELNNCLSKEPRLRKHEADVSYTGDGLLRIDLRLYPVNTDNNIDLNLVLTETGNVEIINEEA